MTQMKMDMSTRARAEWEIISMQSQAIQMLNIIYNTIQIQQYFFYCILVFGRITK